MNKFDYLIVGAGISGALLAQALKGNNFEVKVLEKSKGLGGRIATRRIQGFSFDHGISYLPLDSEEFLKSIKFKDYQKSQDGLYISDGLNQLPKYLLKNIEVIRNEKVVKISKNHEYWIAITDSGKEFFTSNLIITCPLPQAIDLFKQSSLESSFVNELKKIEYQKSILCLGISHEIELLKSCPIPFIKSIDYSNLKGSHPNGFIITTTDSFTQENFEKDELEIEKQIKNFLKLSLKKDIQFQEIQIKKWRYARPINTLPMDFYEYLPNLFLIGDYFNKGHLLGSIESANSYLKKIMP